MKNLFYIGFIAFVLFVALVGYGGYLENEKRLTEGLRKEVLIVDKDKRMSSTGLMSSPKYSVKFYMDKNFMILMLILVFMKNRKLVRN